MVTRHPYDIDTENNMITGEYMKNLTVNEINKHLPDNNTIDSIERCNCKEKFQREQLDVLDETYQYGLYICNSCYGFYVKEYPNL